MALLLALFTGSCGLAAVDPQVEAILTQQRAALSTIASLQFSGRIVAKLGQQRLEALEKRIGAKPAEMYNDLVFDCKGAKYRSAVTVGDSVRGTFDETVRAFNGESYQFLSGTKEKTLRITKRSDDTNPYGTTHPLMSLFAFAVSPNDIRSLTVLQHADPWSRLAQKATSLREGEVLGHPGATITFSDPENGIVYDVFFASDLHWFPVQWKLTRSDGRVSECSVSATKVFGDGDSAVVMPIHIAGTERKADKMLSDTTISVNPDTMAVNQPVDDSVFTISPSKGTHYLNQDTGASSRSTDNPVTAK